MSEPEQTPRRQDDLMIVPEQDTTPTMNQSDQIEIEETRASNPLADDRRKRQVTGQPLTVDDLPKIPSELDPKRYHPKVVELRSRLIAKARQLEQEVRNPIAGASPGSCFTPKEGWEIRDQCRSANKARHIVGEGKIKGKVEKVADGQ